MDIKNFPNWWVVECPPDKDTNKKWKDIINFIILTHTNDDKFGELRDIKIGLFYGIHRQVWDKLSYSGIKIGVNTILYSTVIEYQYTNEPNLTILTIDEAHKLLKKNNK